jgi:hypothetical protein
MKIMLACALFALLVFPVFSEDPNMPKYSQLSDSMGNTVSRNTSALENFDLSLLNNDQLGRFTRYRDQHNSLIRSLQESETRLSQLIKVRAPRSHQQDERDKYEKLIKRTEDLKSEFDSWMKDVK